MIYYFCFDNAKPTGGNKIAYRHVDLLNTAGMAASIVHGKPGFRFSALGEQIPVISLQELRLNSGDIFVLPEDLGPRLNAIARGIPKIIFNQNAYYSFRGYKLGEGLAPPYLDPEYIATFVVSEDNKRYLEYAFPGLRCRRLHVSFRQDLFSCPDLTAKRRQICFMTRKNAGDVAQVVNQLRLRNYLAGWSFIAIENASEQQVAQIMAESAIFLSFGHPEGISLSNLEAMACGCYVVGYSGMGCREYFDAGHCLEVPFGDITAFVAAVEQAAALFDGNAALFQARVQASQAYARHTYSPERERRDVLQAFTELLGRTAPRWAG